jgi:para-aminobenzoate synthetase component 1
MQATALISEVSAGPYSAVAALRAAWREPVEVLAAFADEAWAIGLLSGGGGADGRWSYLARAPDAALIFGARDNGDPFAALAALVGPPSPRLADGPPFQGGVAGLAAYELGDHVEPLGLARHPDWPDLACARYPASR